MTNSNASAEKNQTSRRWLIGLVIYCCLVDGVTYGMLQLRDWSLENYSTEKAQADWESWREETRQLSTSNGPVQRRVPKSNSPPVVRLMQDYFWTCWLAIIMMLGVIYGTMYALLIGAFGNAIERTKNK